MLPIIRYEFTATVWVYESPGGWHFVSLPESMSAEIRSILRNQEEGWGRLKAVARIGKSEWKTAIWYDTKRCTYVLPLKSEIRKKEQIEIGKRIEVIVQL